MEPGDQLQGLWAGRAWCPTPDALRTLRSAGADPEPSPGVDVLARVNDRRFLFELGLGAEGAQVIEEPGELSVLLGGAREVTLRLKRTHGAAGRGQVTLHPGSDGQEVRSWALGSLKRGGLIVEPELTVLREVVTHGLITQEGGLYLGPSCLQEVDSRGAWSRTGEAVSVPEGVRAAAMAAGRGLLEAGYFGPFGLDAIVSSGRCCHVASDLNARYTMGWRDPRA